MDICDCGLVTAFPYGPEENLTYELGLKTSFLDGQLTFLATAFYSDYSDMQRTTWAIVGKSQPSEEVPEGRDIGTLLTTNLAEASIKGIELEFDWAEPWKGGRVYGWVTYLDATIDKMDDGDDGWFCLERALLGLSECAPEDPDQVRGDESLRRPVDYSGNKLPWSPEYALTVTAEHNWYFENGLRLSPYASMHWQSEMFFQDSNFDEGAFHTGQKAFATFTAALRLINEEDAWGVEVYCNNCTDELVRQWVDGGPGYQRASFFPPRMYGIRANVSF